MCVCGWGGGGAGGGAYITFHDMSNLIPRHQDFLCLKTLSYSCISAPVTNTGAMLCQSQTDRSRLQAKGDKAALHWSRKVLKHL